MARRLGLLPGGFVHCLCLLLRNLCTSVEIIDFPFTDNACFVLKKVVSFKDTILFFHVYGNISLRDDE